MNRSSEKGIAMILALFMVLVLSVLSTSMMFVSQTETWASQNYRMTSQTRYAAESGMHRAANYIMFGYTPPSTGGADDIVNYDTTTSPVEFNGQPVVLSSDPDVASNYPVAATVNAFANTAVGAMTLNDTPVSFDSVATLMSMQEILDAGSGNNSTLQTWRIESKGGITGARSAEVEVAVVLERQPWPMYTYAAFATGSGCGVLNLTGGATTDSYDSSGAFAGPPPTDLTGGDVGSNGNLTGSGGTTVINGTLSTPRAGVGKCTSNNVTAASLNGATITEGLVELPQALEYPTPPEPDPLPPTTVTNFLGAGCPASVPVANCTPTATGAVLDPAATGGTITLDNVTVAGGAQLHLSAGTYIVNSLTTVGGSKIIIDSGPVIFQVAGKNGNGTEMVNPITIAGNSVSNPSYDPSDLQILYAGTKNVNITGGTESAMLVYAPNASVTFGGGADFYGSVVGARVTTNGATIHYDRSLANSAFTSSAYTLSSFTWKSY